MAPPRRTRPALQPSTPLPRLRSGFRAALLALVVAACGGGRPGPRILAGPTLIPSPNPAAPLAATIDVETDVPVKVELAIDDGERTTRVSPNLAFATQQTVLVLGIPADHEASIEVAVVDADGNRTVAPAKVEWRTPPLPSGFPPVKVTVRDPKRMEPGVTFFNARGSGPPAVPPTSAYLIMVDDLGRVVWFLESKRDIVSATHLRNGNLLYLSGRQLAIEVDLFGNTVQQWYASRVSTDEMPEGATKVDVDTLHHDLYELPAGAGADFIALSTELREYDDYPYNEHYQDMGRHRANVVGDVIVEFDRDGKVVRRVPLLNALDPRRVCYDSLEDFWNRTYNDVETDDWAHANAVLIDPKDGNYVVSCRNQDAVIKLERATGKVMWILGPPMNWRSPWRERWLRPEGEPFAWSYHQHAPVILPNGDIALFDNGNGRATPPMIELREGARYSRAVIYRIDEKAQTVRQVWSYGSPAEPWYSFFLGNVVPMPRTGNLLVTDGGKQISPSVRQGYARVFEVTRSERPEIVFELVVRDEAPLDASSWNVYRSERLKSVYPER